MWTWLKQYHSDLIRRGTASRDVARYGEIQRIAFPWLLPLCGMVIVAAATEPLAVRNAYWINIFAALLLGLPAMLGMLYATGAFLIAALRADLRKRRTSSPDAPQS